MKPSIQSRLEQLVDRFEEVSALLSDSSVIGNQDRFRNLSREFAEIEPVVHCFQAWQQSLEDIEAAEELANDGDADMREMAEEELKSARQKSEELDEELQRLMLPKDPNDRKNAFLEIRAGTGGDEAAIFAETEKAVRALRNGSDPETVLRSLARGLTNKLLHEPSVQVRKATTEGRTEVTEWLRELHQLDALEADAATTPEKL